ncbi:hypothetical protein [Lacinutrix sp. Hel_I_90]|uniref:hypothetical protein n=1 Tax=Lacinutrix sp. Hel_I_90 TaxID=1249999 RepID=UPI000A48666D|nr:hypothetical protein [Lacinutrix sp. Hel_I_90]
MKTQNKKLNFDKSTVIELGDVEARDIEGGTAWYCVSAILVVAVTVTVSDEQVISVVHH